MTTITTLQLQCDQVGWPLHIEYARRIATKRWSRNDGKEMKAEEIVAEGMIATGHLCCWCEGGSINLLMKAAALKVLVERNPFGQRKDAIERYFEAQCVILKDSEEEILMCIATVTQIQLEANILEILENKTIQKFYPNASKKFIFSLAQIVDRKLLVDIATLFMRKPYDYRSGWPDLTVLGKGSVSFVEVKTTDKLNYSQLRFATDFSNPLRLSCKVVQLRPQS